MAALELTSAALSIALLMFRLPTDWKSWYKSNTGFFSMQHLAVKICTYRHYVHFISPIIPVTIT